MFRSIKSLWAPVLAAILIVTGAYAFTRWREAGMRGGQKYAEPFQIAGNFYFVGANDISSFLITTPKGHILLDGGYPRTPDLIIPSIRKLGFDIKDVKILINSETHYDHAGGLAELQKASGAQAYASESSADVIESGGDDPANALPFRALVWLRLTRYPPARVDRRLKDGDTVTLGGTTLTAHVTPGHTQGCTSWSFPVEDKGRTLNVVSACSLNVMLASRYKGYQSDFERTFRVLRGLKADIWVTSHGKAWGRYRKFVASKTAKNPVDAFIDPEGYRTYIDSGEAEFKAGRTH